MAKSVIIDGVEYVPKEEESSTQGFSDEELINRSLFLQRENEGPERTLRGFSDEELIF